MNRQIHSNKDIEKLKSNQYVLKCSKKMVIYTYEFKKKALELYKQGLSPNEIWRISDFDLNMFRTSHPRERVKGWRDIVKKRGLSGLKILHGSSGRRKTKDLSDVDKIKYLQLQVKYLEAENDFLAKLRAKKEE